MVRTKQHEIDSYEEGKVEKFVYSFILFTMKMENGWEKWIEKHYVTLRPDATNGEGQLF